MVCSGGQRPGTEDPKNDYQVKLLWVDSLVCHCTMMMTMVMMMMMIILERNQFTKNKNKRLEIFMFYGLFSLMLLLLLGLCIIVTHLNAYSSHCREKRRRCVRHGDKIFKDPAHVVYAFIHDLILVFQVLGHWYEVERSFYLPEIASGCTTFEFQPYNKADLSKFNNFKLEVSIKTVNRM